MRKLYILKALLDLFWFFLLIGVFGLVLFVGYMFYSKEPIDIPLNINGEKVVILDLYSKIVIFLLAIAYGFFVYAIFLFKKVLKNFSQRLIFDKSTIILMHQTGKYFLITSVFTFIPAFIYKLISKQSPSIEFGGGFNSFLFTASLGLFFMVLAEVFVIGKTIKEENDLTI